MLKSSATLRPHRTERVIAAGRLLLAIFLVLAVELDPESSDREAAVLELLSLGYLAYAGSIFVVAWSRRTTAHFTPIATHLVDMGVFSLLMHVTEGPTTPFFIYFVFAVVCGTLRWHGRGALLTGAAALFLYAIVAMASPVLLPVRDDFDQTRLLTRCTQLGVITLLLAYFGAYQQRLQTEIASLAAWPRRLPASDADALREVLASASTILRAPRLVVLWQESEEPSLRVAVTGADRIDISREPPDRSVVAAPLQQSSFFCTDVSASRPYVVQRVPGGFASWRGMPVDPAFSEQHRIRSVLALKLATEDIEGYLFALDRVPLSIDDLLVGDIVGRLVAGALEQQTLVLQLRERAAGEERLRLARDLHDGVLQALTALGLQAARIRAVITRDPAEAERRITVLEDTVTTELRGLREMLEDLHPGRRTGGRVEDPIGALRDVLAHLGRRWDVTIHERLARDMPRLPRALVHDICRMAEEAVGNAIRHGGAKEVTVAFDRADGGVRLMIDYRGRGFATFAGRHDLKSLDRLQAGPRMLKERVAARGGDLIIESDVAGACLEIVIGAMETRRDAL